MRASNSGRLPGSSREPPPEALEPSPPGAQGPQGQAPGVLGATRDSSRASGEGSREDPGSRPELEIRFLSVPEQYAWRRPSANLFGPECGDSATPLGQ